jgi:hypothetical protein|tara:strand:+ start:6615 stop:7040 length:426 start_codon:yes stop_codon:yes gene_type:complete
MEVVHYPERFDVRDSRLSTLVLDAAVGMGQYRLGGKVGSRYEGAINKLAEIFHDLSTNPKHAHLIPEGVVLGRFFWPKDYPESLEGETVQDLRIKINYFAEELSDYRGLPGDRQNNLIRDCIRLADLVLQESDQGICRFAA